MDTLMVISDLLKRMIEKGASDLHIGAPSPPILRIHGDLKVQTDLSPLSDADTQKIFNDIASPEQIKRFNEEKEIDFAHSVPGLARFRVNILLQRGSLSINFRAIPYKIPTMDELGLPPVIKQIALRRRGLVLVTGRTGSGKSTTMAAMVNYINENESRNIITIEEPLEFLHSNKKSLISQREVGNDTDSFNIALIHALRHDPDVVVVGEMRDLETITTAITAAETGHLVLATLHTYNAPQSVERMIDVFPPEQQPQIRIQLSQVIEAIITQTLLHQTSGGRIAALEIMIGLPSVRHLIREGKIHQLHSLMHTGVKDGMQILDQELAYMVLDGKITQQDALLNCEDVDQLKSLIASSPKKR
jgi:twitching motility protein PilT